MVSKNKRKKMKFRPCIDLHAGRVKQIVGSTLSDNKEKKDAVLETNFESEHPSSYFAELYRRDGLTGGHVIMLGPGNTAAAKSALAAYPGGLQVGGGIRADNAREWIEAGASHVIVTSYVFDGPELNYDKLSLLVEAAGGVDKVVLDLSCRKKQSGGEQYFVVTDKWQTFTDVAITPDLLCQLSKYCCEFLIHGVEVEGKRCGILQDLVAYLGQHSPILVTYAGGVQNMDDLELVKKLGNGKVDLTIGSALDCFGGTMSYDQVVSWHTQQQ
uniref:1-(5-phosphoribosyl)-5-[(5-phosphoribosylamino)methylideneamino]imidazole-4-carboxamideisomerase n=1 Tax=Eucampia antarctica TaxID=49252 RepID=A0A7S2RQ24_9STRA